MQTITKFQIGRKYYPSEKSILLQVITASTGTSSPAEVREALHRAGFSGRADSYVSAGNWIVKELK